MITVKEKGDILDVPDPTSNRVTRMQNVVFTETGRTGAQKGIANSANVLSQAIGMEAGLVQTRTHTQPVPIDAAAQLQIGQQIGGVHINRKMTSFPEIRNQVDKAPRWIDGNVTFFTTYLDNSVREDLDERLPLSEMLKFRPDLVAAAKHGATTTTRANADGSNGRLIGPDEATTAGTFTPSANDAGRELTTSGAPGGNAGAVSNNLLNQTLQQ